MGMTTRLSLILTMCLPSAALALEMKAGVAKAPITNDQPMVTVNGPVSQGTLKDIYARVLVLNDGRSRLVIVTYDLNCLDVATPLLRKRVEKELGIDKSHLILLATHNHNAPIQIVPENFQYGHWLADKIFDLIQQAIATERGPVKVELGVGDGYFIFSRGSAPVDYEIQVLKVSQGDQPLALLFNHGTHPAQASENLIGPGHPGWAMDEVEASMPGVQAMYCDGVGGNQFVRGPGDYLKHMQRARDESPQALDAYMLQVTKYIARQLTIATLKICNGEMIDVTGPITSSYEIFSLPLAPPMPEAEARKLAETVPMDVDFVPYPHKDRETNWVRMLIRYYDEGLEFPTKTTDMVCTDDTYLVRKDDDRFLKKYENNIDDTYPSVYEETIVAKIGNMPFVAMQGEVCAPIGARIKDAFRADGPIFVTAYMGEHNLYIPTRELVRQDAYQAQVIRIQYACPVGWDPSVEDEMVANVVRMVQSTLQTKDSQQPKPARPRRE
ncbi:MAG: hypothetical protein ABGX16_02195 [Pirellulales bacterium]